MYGKEAASRSFSETSCHEKPRGAPETSSVALDGQQHHAFGGVEDLLNVQQHLQNTSRIASALLDSSTCERIKSILSCLGAAHVVRGQGPEEEPLLSPAPTASLLTHQPNMLQALQSSITGEDLGLKVLPSMSCLYFGFDIGLVAVGEPAGFLQVS